MQIVKTVQELQQAVKEIEKYSVIGFDVETTGLLPHYDKLLLISIAVSSAESYVIDFTHISIEYFSLLAPVLTNSNILKLGFNLVFDWKMVYGNTKVEMVNMFDCMICEQLLSAGLWVEPVKGSTFSLAAVTYRRLGKTRNKDIRNQFIGFQGKGFEYEAYTYASEDTQDLFLIYEQQLGEIKKKELEKVCALDMSLIACTSLMEYTGILVDREKLEGLVEPFTKYVETCHRALQDVFISNGAGEEILFDSNGYTAINPASKPQMLQALKSVGITLPDLRAKTVVKWDFKNSKRQEAVAYTDFIDDEDVADALEKYGGIDNPILRLYTFLIGAEKLLNTYVLKQLDRIDQNTGRLYGWFKILGARSTGRYSSNVQQIPNDIKLARLGLKDYSIRQCFIAPKGRVFIGSDYSAIEAVIIADMSGDDRLAYEHIHGDLHITVAHETIGHFYSEVLKLNDDNKKKQPFKAFRDASKRVTYGIAYGIGGMALADQMTIDLASTGIKVTSEQGEAFKDIWLNKTFPQAGKFLQGNARCAVTRGYTESALGRKRFWNLERISQDKWKFLAAQREGSNHPIQATSADMIKLAMSGIYQRLDRRKARIVLCVHDEILIESVSAYAETACLIMKEEMENAAKTILPKLGKHVIVDPELSERYVK